MNLQRYRDEIEAENDQFLDSLAPEEQTSRRKGVYFWTLEALCNTRLENLSPSGSNFSRVKRSEKEGAMIYLNTANTEYLEACTEATSSQSDATNTLQKFTCVDFLYNVEGERAHLFSNAPLCHVAYLKIAQAASGFFVDSYYKRRKLLNGMKGRNRRMADSGIKHSKYNKFHLFLQKPLFDSTPPALIILPILTLANIKSWNGTPYYALVLPCGVRATYASRNVLQYARDCCTKTDIEIAINGLKAFVLDIAESLIDCREVDVLEEVNITAGRSTDVSIVRWMVLVRELRGSPQPRIDIPALKVNLDWETVKVAKGKFDVNSSCLPDPFLLAVKGAVNFSSHCGRKLMPACPTENAENDPDDEDRPT